MSSAVEICNQALSMLGQSRIVSFSDDTKRARVAALLYPDRRDALLRSHRWKFAIKRVSLPALATAPLFGYASAYQIPTDALRILSVNELDPETDPTLSPTLWDREGDTIVADEPAPILVRYIARIIDTQRFDLSFARALTVDLAAAFAPELLSAVDRALINDLSARFSMEVAEARRLASIEGRPRQRTESFSRWVYGGTT